MPAVKNPTFSQAQVLAALHYDPSTGHFTRLIRTNNRHRAGGRADRQAGKYRVVSLLGVSVLAHRLAYFYMTGEWPQHVLDHKDRNGQNNAWENIRPCTQAQNLWNQPPRADLKGVSQDNRDGRWRAQITIDGKQYAVGTFDSKEEAHAAWCEVSRKLRREFHHET